MKKQFNVRLSSEALLAIKVGKKSYMEHRGLMKFLR